MAFFRAYQHMQKGGYQQAILGFKQALKEDHSSAPCYSNLALCYEAEKMYEESITCWEEYIKLNPLYVDRAKAHLLLIKDMQKAITQLKEKRTDIAHPLLAKIAKDTFPQSFIRLSALKWLMDYYFSQAEYGKVIDRADNILRNYKKTDFTPDNLFAYAQSLKKKNKPVLARRYFQEMVFLDTDLFEGIKDAEYKLATAYFNLDKYKEAIEKYKSYIDKNSQNSLAEESLYQLGLSLKAALQHAEAIRIFGSFQGKYPAGRFIPDIKYQIGLCYHAQGDKEHASKQYQYIIKNYPEKDIAGDAHFQIGKILLGQEEKEKAYMAFRALIKRYPKARTTPEAIYLLAENRFKEVDELNSVYWQESNLRYYDDVINQLNIIISDYSSYPYNQNILIQVQKLIMQCYERQARYDKKGFAYYKYLKLLASLYGQDKAAEDLLETADAYLAQSKFFEAKQCYIKLIKMFSGSKKIPYAYYKTGVCYNNIGSYKKAIINYKKVLSFNNVEKALLEKACFGLVNSFNAERKYAQTIKVLNIFLKNFPRSEFIIDAKFYLGYFYYQQKDYRQSKKAFQELIRSHPENFRSLISKSFLENIEKLETGHIISK